MRKRHLPRVWLLTDPRIGEALWDALERLPRGGGVVVRDPAIVNRVRAVARRRGLIVTVAGVSHIASTGRRGRGAVVTASAHNRAELFAARRAGANLVFVSPVFATRSHPGARALGRVRFGLLTRGAGIRVAALGGMSARCFRGLKAYGWGAIDTWLA